MSDRQLIVIVPPKRFPLPNLKVAFEARDVLYSFSARDITLRYRQTALGVVWVVGQPLMTALVFTLVFGKVAKLPTGGVPYILFSFAGLLAWNMFSSVVTRASISLITNAGLVSKVYFPRMMVPLSVCGSALLDFAVTLVVMIILLAVYGVVPGVAVLLLPIWAVMVLFLALGLGLVTAALMVRFRDVNYIVPFFLQFLQYASPLAYSVTAIPSRYRWLYNIDPLTWLFQDFRYSLLNTPAPPAWQLMASVLVPAAVFFCGVVYFEHAERGFADFI